MELSRERFIEQFAITIQVTCLRLWRRRAKTVPIFLGRSFYEAMTTSGGGKQLLSHTADTRSREVFWSRYRGALRLSMAGWKAHQCRSIA